MAKYDQLIIDILDKVGGQENITFATHCMTRLRLNLKDKSAVNIDQLKNVPGVLGAQFSGEQFQIIIGQHVDNVYDEFVAKTGLAAAAPVDENLDKEPFSLKKVPGKIMDAIAGCVTPILPILTAAGMFKLLAAFLGPDMFNILPVTNAFLQFVTFIGDAGFYFFPVYLAWSASRKFNTNPAVAMFLGCCLIHPSFLAIVEEGNPITLFGIPLTLINYSSQFLPSVLAVWVMSYVYRWFDNISPKSIKILFVPTLTMAVMLPLTYFFIGPVAYYAGLLLGAFIQFIYSILGPVAVALVAGLWYYLVATGMHQTLISFAVTTLATNGFDPIVLVGGNIGTYAMFGMCLAYLIRCKKTDKALASANAATLILGGISEPTIFSTLLRYKQAMISYSLGGLAGGLLAGLLGVSVYFFGPTNFLSITATGPTFVQGLISAGVAFAISLGLGIVLGFDENGGKGFSFKKKGAESTKTETKSSSASSPAVKVEMEPGKLASPLSGKVIDITEVKDAAFSSKAMGDGVAIVPTQGKVIAPFNGEVVAIFPTNHAIGLKSEDGTEILVHIGLDTVNENGNGFNAKVKQGDKVKAGQTVIEFDLDGLKKKGYDLTTPVIVTSGKDIANKSIGRSVVTGKPVADLKDKE